MFTFLLHCGKILHRYNMENEEILKKLHETFPIEKDLGFSELNMQEKLKENATKIVTYRDFYHKELARMDHLEDLMQKLVGMRYKFYRFDDVHEWSKIEIEKFCIPQDRKIMKMKKIIRRQNVRVRFFEMCWKGFEKQQWGIKSFLDTLKVGY